MHTLGDILTTNPIYASGLAAMRVYLIELYRSRYGANVPDYLLKRYPELAR